jgi:hypothetical protein
MLVRGVNAAGCVAHLSVAAFDEHGKTAIASRDLDVILGQTITPRILSSAETVIPKLSAMVEHEHYAGRSAMQREVYVVRLLIRNPMDFPILVGLADHSVHCSDGSEARWALSQDRALQGSDAGPVALDKSSWFVFVQPIRIQGNAAKCIATFSVGAAYVDDGSPAIPRYRRPWQLRPLATISVPVVATQHTYLGHE